MEVCARACACIFFVLSFPEQAAPSCEFRHPTGSFLSAFSSPLFLFFPQLSKDEIMTDTDVEE